MSEASQEYSNSYQDLFICLAAPFEDGAVKQRTQGGRTFDYISARTAQNRLDSVVGPHNWKASYREIEKGVVCTISIRLPTGEWIDKCDAGGFAGMTDEGDNEKSAYSDSFKRAAVAWGIGRHLYGDGVPDYARQAFPNGSGAPRGRSNSNYISQPEPAKQATHGTSSPPPTNGNGGSRQYDDSQVPANGKGLYAWAKKRGEGEQDQWMWVQKINDFGKSMGFPDRMVDWDEARVAQAYRQVNAAPGSQPEPARGQPASQQTSQQHSQSPTGSPRTGRELWAWCLAQKPGRPTVVDEINQIIKDEYGGGKITELGDSDVRDVLKALAEKDRRREAVSSFKPSTKPPEPDHSPVPRNGDVQEVDESEIPF